MRDQDALPYFSLPGIPSETSPGSVLARLVSGLGFRLHWATEGLRPVDFDFRAHPTGQSIGEVLEHIGQMVSWVHAQFTAGLPGATPLPDLDPDHGPVQRREHCLRGLACLQAHLLDMTAADLDGVVVDHPRRGRRSFWVLVNGPISDALTHVGQISVWRRAAGNPAPASDPFDGLPPQGVPGS
ncbi:MAG: hypothetical protein ACI8QZ_004353 [Chlamydiales bacterium]|jgi:hypothetical protein